MLASVSESFFWTRFFWSMRMGMSDRPFDHTYMDEELGELILNYIKCQTNYIQNFESGLEQQRKKDSAWDFHTFEKLVKKQNTGEAWSCGGVEQIREDRDELWWCASRVSGDSMEVPLLPSGQMQISILISSFQLPPFCTLTHFNFVFCFWFSKLDFLFLSFLCVCSLIL